MSVRYIKIELNKSGWAGEISQLDAINFSVGGWLDFEREINCSCVFTKPNLCFRWTFSFPIYYLFNFYLSLFARPARPPPSLSRSLLHHLLLFLFFSIVLLCEFVSFRISLFVSSAHPSNWLTCKRPSRIRQINPFSILVFVLPKLLLPSTLVDDCYAIYLRIFLSESSCCRWKRVIHHCIHIFYLA